MREQMEFISEEEWIELVRKSKNLRVIPLD